ncbi:MAG: P-loop NTPase [Myxococcota bacterium]
MRVLSVTSGKGGVGKTAVSMNLAVSLAQRGWRTALLDCDFGLANVALNMGLNPTRSLRDVLEGRPISEAFTEGPHGLQVLAGSRSGPSLVELRYDELRHLAVGFEELDRRFDFLVLDNAAGVAPSTVSVSAAADEAVLVFTPDPSAMMDAYASAKLLFRAKPKAKVSCVVNQVKSDREAQALFEQIRTIALNFLSEHMSYMGSVRRDEAMVRAGRRRCPVTVGETKSMAARDFEQLAERFSGFVPATRADRGFIDRLLRRLEPATGYAFRTG